MSNYALMALLAAPASTSDFELNSIRAADLVPARTVEVPAPELLPKAGYIQMTSSVKMKVDREQGELAIGFPRVEFGDGGPGDKAHLFVKLPRGKNEGRPR